MLKFIKKKISKIDLYGKKVSLTHNGGSTFKTSIGGVASFITLALWLMYLIILIVWPIRLISLNQSKWPSMFYYFLF